MGIGREWAIEERTAARNRQAGFFRRKHRRELEAEAHARTVVEKLFHPAHVVMGDVAKVWRRRGREGKRIRLAILGKGNVGKVGRLGRANRRLRRFVLLEPAVAERLY
jgi:hypothetical protein